MASMKRVWAMQNTQIGSRNKIALKCEKRFYKHIKVVLCKKPLERAANIRQMRAFCK